MDASELASTGPNGPAVHGTRGSLRRALAFALLTAVSACGDPCRSLADDVCRCAFTRADEQRCLRHVRALAGQSAASQGAGRQRCAALADSCTCEALAAGDLAACGLTEAAP